MKILICQLRNHGDIIRTFPLIEALKASCPGCFIGFTCLPEMEDTVKLCRDIDEIILQPRLTPIKDHVDNTRICDCASLEESALIVREKKYEVYIDLHGVFQSSVFGCISQIPVRVGRSKHTAKDGAPLFYTHVAEIKDKETNRMERHFLIAQRYFENLQPVLNKSYEAFEKNQAAVIPGSSVKGILKRWELEGYKELIGKMAEKEIVRVLLGPEEFELYKEFKKLETGSIIVETVGSFEKYCEIFKNCRYVVGNDSAALHIAVWKGIPAFTICGPTSASINSVWKYGRGKGITSGEKCFCKDVWSGVCEKEHRCMKSITSEMVMEEIEQELA
jgi:heptosyltransferase-2